jgi:mannose-6-phosphate isomerase-like protein (cupin superfamily)
MTPEQPMAAPRWTIRKLGDTDAVPCPCGSARRILTRTDGGPVSIHRVTISTDAKLHYHKALTEHYIVLSGSGEMELDGERVPVGPGDVAMIPPLVRHAARGKMEIINVVCPPFDPEDEWVAE